MDADAGICVILAGEASWDTISATVQANIDSKAKQHSNTTLVADVYDGFNSIVAGKLDSPKATQLHTKMVAYINKSGVENKKLHSEFLILVGTMADAVKEHQQKAFRSRA